MKIDRRSFLKASGFAVLSTALAPTVFTRMARASVTGGRRVLVVVFLRGAVDGLNVIVPHGEAEYYGARPTIAIPRPGQDGGAIDLDGFFGAHPSLAPLMPLYRNGSIAFVHAAGSPDASRSHFDAQDFMESGTPGIKTTQDGFLTRALRTKPPARTPLRTVSFTPIVPRILAGGSGAIAIQSLSQFNVGGGTTGSEAEQNFEALYENAVDRVLGGLAKNSFEAVDILRSGSVASIKPSNGAQYAASPLAAALRQIAQLIKADVGVEVAFTDVAGWDTHYGEGASTGVLASSLAGFADATSAFVTDLGSRMENVVLIGVSEFGRTVKENGSRGTDHGHGNVMVVLGGPVKGGKVYGNWPGLGPEQLFEQRDLAVTTDFRDVFGEILTKHLGVSRLGAVFPSYENSRAKWRGMLR